MFGCITFSENVAIVSPVWGDPFNDSRVFSIECAHRGLVSWNQYGCAAQEKAIPVWAGPLDCIITVLWELHPPGVTFQLCGSHEQAEKLCPQAGHSVTSRSPLRRSLEEVFPPKAPKLDCTNPCSLCHGSEERSREPERRRTTSRPIRQQPSLCSAFEDTFPGSLAVSISRQYTPASY